MGNILIRIAVVILAMVGLYKLFPQIAKPVDYYIKHPQFVKGVVRPAVNTANSILPEKLQIPSPPEVMGVSYDASTSSPLKDLTHSITRQAASIAGEQIVELKKSATDTFCQTIIEKIKTECGSTNLPQ